MTAYLHTAIITNPPLLKLNWKRTEIETQYLVNIKGNVTSIDIYNFVSHGLMNEIYEQQFFLLMQPDNLPVRKLQTMHKFTSWLRAFILYLFWLFESDWIKDTVQIAEEEAHLQLPIQRQHTAQLSVLLATRTHLHHTSHSACSWYHQQQTQPDRHELATTH